MIIDETPMDKVTYYSECECGAIVEGVGEIDRGEGTLYGENCTACGEEFVVSGWFWPCDYCDECHEEGECEE